MNYDQWKQEPPPEYDHEEESTCLYCGNPVKDGDKFCSKEHKTANDEE